MFVQKQLEQQLGGIVIERSEGMDSSLIAFIQSGKKGEEHYHAQPTGRSVRVQGGCSNVNALVLG